MSEKIRLTALEKTRLPDADGRSAVRLCPKCGREIQPDRQICPFCENTGEIPRPHRSRRQKAAALCLIVLVFLLVLFLTLYMTRNTGFRG